MRRRVRCGAAAMLMSHTLSARPAAVLLRLLPPATRSAQEHGWSTQAIPLQGAVDALQRDGCAGRARVAMSPLRRMALLMRC